MPLECVDVIFILYVRLNFCVIDKYFMSFVFGLYNDVRIYWLLSDKCFINRRDSVVLFGLMFLEIHVLIMANARRKYTDFGEFIFSYTQEIKKVTLFFYVPCACMAMDVMVLENILFFVALIRFCLVIFLNVRYVIHFLKLSRYVMHGLLLFILPLI